MSADIGLAVECRGLRKIYRERGGKDTLAVDGLDLMVKRGECFGLLGPNGAGKTTTIEILEGLLEPTSGEVRVLGGTWQRDEDRLRQEIGLSLQETHLPERLRAREVLELFRSFYSSGRSVDEALGLVGLMDKRDAWYEKLSGGQKQRLAVACALVGTPKLLFLDEPTTGLDPQSRRQLWDVIVDYRRAGGTTVLTTHYMDEAERLCDRIAIVDHGKVIAIDTPQGLIASLEGSAMVEFSVDERMGNARLDEAELAALRSVRAVDRVADGWSLTVESAHEALPALVDFLAKKGSAATRLQTHSATLEDVFVHLTGRQLRD